jgi:hypothetical protein
MDKSRYTVEIVIAAPGTALMDPQTRQQQVDVEGTPQTSGPGHMFYVLHATDTSPKSFGFAPAMHGSVNGPGAIKDDDALVYKEPRYTRTLEITADQYRKLETFGESPERLGFSKQYQDVRNNCVDFTWAALNHAGIERKNSIDLNQLGGGLGQLLPDVRISLESKGEGKDSYRPLRNIHSVDSIEPPIPDSELNKTHYNKMPERDPLQRVLSEHQMPARSPDLAVAPGATAAGPEHDPLLSQIRQRVAGLDAENGRAFDATSQNISASLYTLAKAHGITQVDHVLLSERTAQAQPAQHIFIVQGAQNDPAHLRASMPTALAASTPAEASLERVAQLTQNAQVHAQDAPQPQSQEPSGPRLG